MGPIGRGFRLTPSVLMPLSFLFFSGKYSTDKIREKNSSCGACIIRQCEEQYDTYYVDMLETEYVEGHATVHAVLCVLSIHLSPPQSPPPHPVD